MAKQLLFLGMLLPGLVPRSLVAFLCSYHLDFSLCVLFESMLGIHTVVLTHFGIYPFYFIGLIRLPYDQ